MGKKIDYENKARVINSGFCELEKYMSKISYMHYHVFTSDVSDEFDWCKQVFYTLSDEDYLDLVEAHKINHSEYKKKKRLKDRIENMLSLGSCIFATLTFSEPTLAATSFETRKKYVKEYLKEHSDNYVANVDYGKQNGREHYHAVILCDRLNLELWQPLGYIFAEPIRNTKNDMARLSKYVAKLTNHALKITGKRQVLIYSRPKKRESIE